MIVPPTTTPLECGRLCRVRHLWLRAARLDVADEP
jgi:hypothetical protein